MKLKNMYASNEKAVLNSFLGINRRIRTSAGEFSDMENLSPAEYPCICSQKGTLDTGYTLPQGVEAVKMIIPKRLAGPVTGFSGIVKNSDGGYAIYINGVSRRNDINEFTDAVDYNGSIIVMPELKGFNYVMKSDINADGYIDPVSLTIKMQFHGNDNSDYIFFADFGGRTDAEAKEYIEERFSVGDSIILSGLTGNLANNNTWYPQSIVDYSNQKSPVSIYIKSISYAGSHLNPTCTFSVSLTNSKGKGNIGWPSGVNMSEAAVGTLTKLIPRSTYGCVAHNRVWLCSYTGEEIYASSPGTPTEFYNLAGLSSDSWVASSGTPGRFTGIAPWQNRVVVFKPDIIHVVYGNLPTTFGIEKTYAAGCIDGGSIAEVGGCLMWLYYDGFYIYSGSRPRRVSDKLNTRYVSCKAFSDGRRYYARCVKEDGTGEFLIYDSELNLWSKISDIDIVSGDYYGGKVYLSDKTRLYVLGEGEYGDFYAETPELTFDSFMDKSVMYITVRCKIQKGFLNIYTSVNNGEWVPHKGIDKTGKHKLPIRYNPGDILRLRLEGSGNVCITEMELEVVTKGGS